MLLRHLILKIHTDNKIVMATIKQSRDSSSSLTIITTVIIKAIPTTSTRLVAIRCNTTNRLTRVALIAMQPTSTLATSQVVQRAQILVAEALAII